ncbi:26S proteasome non-ATPase regulatory subunit 2-like B, partial [Mucuna pruriens]
VAVRVKFLFSSGFKTDKLMIVPSDSSSSGSSGNWIFKIKNMERLVLELIWYDMILLWDVDSGLAHIDKYFHGNDNHVIAGALLGVGIVNCNIKNDYDLVSSFCPSLCSI